MLAIISSIIGLFKCNDNRNDEELNDIKADIKMIKENHLHHIEKDISEIKMDIKILLSR